MARSRMSRLVRVAAVLFIAIMLFSSGVDSTLAAKSGGVINGNLPISISNPNPASTVIANPTPIAGPVINGQAPINTAGSATSGSDASGNASASSTSNDATVSVTVIVCPRNYNTFYAINDFTKATTDCKGTPNGVPIHLLDSAGDHKYLAGGRITWHNVVPGVIYIKGEDDATAIQPFTWCQGDNDPTWRQGAIIDDSLWDNILPGHTLSCLWFVTPMFKSPVSGAVGTNSGVMAPPQNASPVAEGGSLTLNASSACPAGFDAASADIYGLAANCHDSPPVYTLTVRDSSGAQFQSQSGIASFGSVAAGAATVSILLPSGWAAPRVFCKSQQGDVEQEAAVSGDAWTVTILSNQDAYCDVINIPGQGQSQSGATVVSDANFCYDGMLNADYSHANLANTCFPDPNVRFTASVNGQAAGEANTYDGAATISGIPAGVVEIQSFTPETPIIHVLVYCNVSGVGNDQLVNSAGGAIHLNVTDGETTNCSWFFITPGVPQAG